MEDDLALRLAEVMTVEAVKAGKVEEFTRLIHAEVLPLMAKQTGFRQDLTVMNTGTGMSMSLWDNRTSAETYNTKTYPEVLKKLNPVLEGTPRIEAYDTVLTTIPNVVPA